MLAIIVDKSYSASTIMLSLIVIHNVAVLGLFALEKYYYGGNVRIA